MLEWLTPTERRGGAVLIGLLVIGTAWDAWRPRSGFVPPPPAGGAFDAGPSGRTDSTPGRGPHSAGERGLDLNRASAAELDALPGIGPVLAARIVEQRERGGAFRRLEDLMAVRGVGPRLLERLRARVQVGSPGPATGLDRGVQSAPRPHAGRADSTSVPPYSTR